MNQQELLTRINALLGRFAYEVKVSNATGMFDINIIAEEFLIPILSVVLKCPDLKNQNRVQMHFPAVDLGCDTSRTSIQITSDPSSQKICKTLNKFQEHNLEKYFDHLYVYIITEKQKSYQSKYLDAEINSLPINFDVKENILDYKDLAEKIGGLKNEELTAIVQHLESSFNKIDSHLFFRKNLSEFINVSQKKIEDEKKSKKYIPSVFVETSEVKDCVRYFANPLFFYRKIDYDLQHIALEKFKNTLVMAKVEPLEINILDAVNLPEPKNLTELNKRLSQQKELIEGFNEIITPFSWRRNEHNKYTPKTDSKDYWTVFKFAVESIGSDIFHHLEDVLEKIRIAKAKIFLITGMAGQGKTNFVCDLVENQFHYFEIPTIFIPARLLNHYPSPNKILSYITNNRFCPNLNNLHELFTLLNNVANESKKPFIIVLDGINEVSDLHGLVDELKVFLEALCQYEFVKIIITCRNEFFDHKFTRVFSPQFSDYIYRVQDLRNEMSDYNKSKLLTDYFSHFNINANLSKSSKAFLENDLILLRLFCEIYENKNIGYVSDIYKGELFENYLKMKIDNFPIEQKSIAICSLRKICQKMYESENFTLVSNADFETVERELIEKLVGEDIILRREVPPSGLMSIGIESISFTYDEMRDFLLAYFVVVDTTQGGLNISILNRMKEWPIYEGLFRYTYILARKHNNQPALLMCEKSDDFTCHYVNNLSLLSSDIQSDDDIQRVNKILQSSSNSKTIQSVAWFLFGKRDTSELLNLGVLNEHLGRLSDSESEHFLKFMFCDSRGYERNSWDENISEFVDSLKNISDKDKLSISSLVLTFVFYLLPHAFWVQRENALNFFIKNKECHNVTAAIDSCRRSHSDRVKALLSEMK